MSKCSFSEVYDEKWWFPQSRLVLRAVYHVTFSLNIVTTLFMTTNPVSSRMGVFLAKANIDFKEKIMFLEDILSFSYRKYIKTFFVSGCSQKWLLLPALWYLHTQVWYLCRTYNFGFQFQVITEVSRSVKPFLATLMDNFEGNFFRFQIFK